MKNELLYEKWRPKKMDDLILPNRIKDHFKNGVTKNYIFYGPYGTGKTSLARILIGKYSGDKAFLEINSSLHTSVETLRNEIDRFCKTKPMMDSDDGMKYVFLDEFEKVSASFQEAFKAFVEHYSANNVRFILSTNHLNKLTDAIKKSRFTLLNFESIGEEEREIKRAIYQKITNEVCPSEGIEISKDDLVNIISKRFPDNRAMYNDIQDYIIGVTGSVEKNIIINKKAQEDLYNLIFERRDYEKTYHFLMGNFGPEKIDKMIELLSKPFIEYCLENKKDKINNLFECNYVVTDYKEKLNTDSDPIIVGMTILGKIQDIMK
jgi:replication factor C small subunit